MRPTLVFIALLAVSMACGGAAAQQKVQFPAVDGRDGAAATELAGYLFHPNGPGPHPAIVFMHGCGGLFSRTTNAIVSRETAWRQQLVDKGFVVLMVDGFTPRDTVEMCSRTSFKEWLYLRRPGDEDPRNIRWGTPGPRSSDRPCPLRWPGCPVSNGNPGFGDPRKADPCH